MCPQHTKRIAIFTMHNTMQYNNHSRPASQALSALVDRLPEPEYIKRANELSSSEKSSSCNEPGAKRQKSSPLNMMGIMSSIKPVEDSIAFPTIEWSYDDFDQDDESIQSTKSCCKLSTDDNLAEFDSWGRRYSSTSSFAKRSCCGSLTRCKTNEICLLSLVSPGSSSQDLRTECLKTLTTSSMSMFALGGGLDSQNSVCMASAEALLEALA